MRIASVTLPLFCIEGLSLADVHADFRRDLSDYFGGFTAQEVTSGWRDEASGQTFEDMAVRYDVAANWDSTTAATLADLVESYRINCRALAVHVQDHTGAVSFATAPEPAERARRDDSKAWKRTRAAERAFKYATRAAAA